eukprot:10303173-Lingulodinium_polyedra.AAC.1
MFVSRVWPDAGEDQQPSIRAEPRPTNIISARIARANFELDLLSPIWSKPRPILEWGIVFWSKLNTTVAELRKLRLVAFVGLERSGLAWPQLRSLFFILSRDV